ncbi:S100P-binding protein-like [Bufo gargarizans]|uniref:S100P-binding protein-like n=1 Tax=Bufo gargarizans TaxID=30331 RepID=UPI001CF186C4|nr:S100P-binding protein-like [Bufo gargarizans]XP_044142402.1 S100P-binding protein-like [Bufo gargarizans]
MKVINDPSMPGAGSERRVLLYPLDREDPFPGTMEEIKISIVNDRATGLKRERDEISAVTPSAKRSCRAGFSCSTPSSASTRTWSSQNPGFAAWQPLGEGDELDDSLLDLSSDESNSPLGLTQDEMDTCLLDDDDDSCYAAEPSIMYNEMPTSVVTFTPSESENEGKNSRASLCETLEIADISAEEPECEGDISSYAAMPPSPSHSAIDPAEGFESNQTSVCNVKSPHELLAAKSVMDSDLLTPLLDIKEAPTSQLPKSCSPQPLQPSISLYRIDDAENRIEDPGFVFDCDIDNILTISPGVAFSSEEDSGVQMAANTTKGTSSVISDSAMSPSPSYSAIDPAEVIEPNQSSVCNVKSPHELLAAKSVMDSDLLTPLSDVKEAPASQLPKSCSSQPLQPSISSYWIDDAENWSEDPGFVFDCDIDNLLTISPGVVFSSEEDSGVQMADNTSKGTSSLISDSAIPPADLESDQVLTVHAASSNTSDATRNHPPPLNTDSLPKVYHHHPPAKPEPINESLPSTTSPIVTAEPKLTTESPGTEQNVESEKPSKVEESNGVQNDEPTSKPTDPTPSANGSQSKIVASSACKTHSSSDPQKKKPVIAVTALRGPSFRSHLSEVEKNNYCNLVLIHISGQGESNLEGPSRELGSLLHQTSLKNPNWKNPSFFTKRNHPRFGKKPSKFCSLNQWVKKNGGAYERFKNFPATFQRSPVPDALPVRPS